MWGDLTGMLPLRVAKGRRSLPTVVVGLVRQVRVSVGAGGGSSERKDERSSLFDERLDWLARRPPPPELSELVACDEVA